MKGKEDGAPISANVEMSDMKGSEMSKAGKAVDVEVVAVTPTQAREWLEVNHVNRNFRPKVVAAYRRDMENKRWQFTGEAIQISRTGYLLNGQHRLAALADAKNVRSIDFVVATGLPDDAQVLMDQGVSRNVRDALLLQHGHVKNLNVVSSLARWLVLSPKVGPQMNPSTMRGKVTVAEAVEVFQEDPEGMTEAAFRGQGMRPVLMGSPTAIAYSWFQLARVDSEQCAEFFAGMLDMDWKYQNDPRKAALRRMLTIHREQEHKASIETGVILVSVVMRAWNAWRNEEELDTIGARTKTGIIVPVTPI